jgi:hypothetical protein
MSASSLPIRNNQAGCLIDKSGKMPELRPIRNNQAGCLIDKSGKMPELRRQL